MPATKRFDVIVIGEINPDLILSGDVTPTFGQVEKVVEDASLVIGSSSVIFACGAARLGLRVAFIGKVGADIFGSFMTEQLKQRGIDTTGVICDSTIKTGLTLTLVHHGDRAMLTYLGSMAALHYSEIDFHLFEQARHLHLGSFYLLDKLIPDVPALFQTAHTHGMTVSLDTNYDPTERWQSGIEEVLQHVDVFMPNETELRAISRERDVPTALTTLAARLPLLAVKQGSSGAVAYRGTEHWHAAPLNMQVVDTIGAGDSFDAGFIYGYLAGWQPARALALGVVCGSLSTRAAGGTAAQPTLAEAMAHLGG